MPTYHITATQNGHTAYYCAFDLLHKPYTLLTTKDIQSAFICKTMEKAQEWKTWLEGKFPEYSYDIKPNSEQQ